jgi:hypothetical protein
MLIGPTKRERRDEELESVREFTGEFVNVDNTFGVVAPDALGRHPHGAPTAALIAPSDPVPQCRRPPHLEDTALQRLSCWWLL